MQNFYDGNGHTLEGVDIQIVKNDDGSYKVRINGDGHYDYSHLESLGDSTKDGDSSSAGGYGEGAGIVAGSLLADPDVNYVRYGSGEWSSTFGRSSDDIETAMLTQTLSQNDSFFDGAYMEFETKNVGLVEKILESKNYFYHPQNADFHNMDFENDYFGFTLLPEGEKGNLYIVQRYEVNGKAEGGLPGISLIFKKMPDDEELVKLNHNKKYKLGTGRDRGEVYNFQIGDLVARYAKTMSDEELAQAISSMEPVWQKPNTKDTELAMQEILRALVFEANDRNLGIDFDSQKYVYLGENATRDNIDMAVQMGYKVAAPIMKHAGMTEFHRVSNGGKKPIELEPQLAAKVHLLDEGIRVLQENCDADTWRLIMRADTEKPTLVFDEGGSPNEAAEAITVFRDVQKYGLDKEYLGHWVNLAALETETYVANLATWIHEISHKSGGDESTEFSNRLIDVQNFIMNVLTHNPAALNKIRVLADMYAELKANKTTDEVPVQSRYKVIKPEDILPFDASAYSQYIQSHLDAPFEYSEYVESGHKEESSQSTEEIPVNNQSPHEAYTKVTSYENNLQQSELLGQVPKSTRLGRIIDKLRGLVRKPHKTETVSEAAPVVISDPKKTTFTYNELKQEMTPRETGPTLSSTEEYTRVLFEEGKPVKFVIPDLGGSSPKHTDVPEIDPADLSKLGKPKSRMTVRYTLKTGWTEEKIARDIMQNFYDGHNHTLEGVGMEIVPKGDGTYRVKITGDAEYSYKRLYTRGKGSKRYSSVDAGGFGEGAVIVAGNLVANSKTPYVDYACGDWRVRFESSTDDIQTADLNRTLTQNDTPVKGNYLEFETDNKDLITALLDARNYFNSPYNKDFQNPTFENEFFAFKVEKAEGAKGNLYYIQRFQTEGGGMSGGLNNLHIIFKRKVDDPQLSRNTRSIPYKIDRDRTCISKDDLYQLGRYYAQSMTKEELMKAIVSLEPVLTAKSTDAKKLLYVTKDNSMQFVRGLIEEAAGRGLKIDFTDAKVVYVDHFKVGNTILPPHVESALSEQGYRFAYSDCRYIGMKSAMEVYNEMRSPRSLEPTNDEVQKLRLLRQAMELFVDTDTSGALPSLAGKYEYVFNAQDSNNTNYHIIVKDETDPYKIAQAKLRGINAPKKYQGLFIDRETLANTDFLTLLSNSIAELLNSTGSKMSSAYSYDLTDCIQSEINTFLTRPDTAEKLKVLEQMYNQIGKNN